MPPNSVSNIGVFGATFDPPHIAHFVAAEWCAQELGLEKVILVPALQNPLKLAHNPAPPAVRMRMVKACIGDDPKLTASSVEIDRGGLSYTIDTIVHLQKQFLSDSHRLYLLLGADNAGEFAQWKDYLAIAEKTTVVIFNRPGYDLQAVSAAMPVLHRIVLIPNLDISSTNIREWISQGKAWKRLVPSGAAEIIESLRLYQ